MVSSDPTYDELAEEYGQNGRGRLAPRGVPQDQAAEESVLGAILAEQGVYERSGRHARARRFHGSEA